MLELYSRLNSTSIKSEVSKSCKSYIELSKLQDWTFEVEYWSFENAVFNVELWTFKDSSFIEP